jgi:hypothetical protein
VRHASSFFNAYTNWDSTHYTTESRPQALDLLLKVEAVRLTHGCEAIPKHEFLREREVVRNELRQRRASEIVELMPALLEAVYPAEHAYARPVIGTESELVGITLDDACAFIQAHYVPERATLIVAGRVDVPTVEASLTRWFRPIAARRGVPRRPVLPVERVGRGLTRQVSLGRPVLAVAWPLPSMARAEGMAAQFVLDQLAVRVFDRVTQKEVAADFHRQVIGGAHAPIFIILIELNDGVSEDDALDLVRQATRDTRRSYYRLVRALGRREESAELYELRVQKKAAFVQEVEPLGARASIIGDMVQFEASLPFLSEQAYLAHALARIDALEGEHIADAVDRLLEIDKATVVRFRATGRPGRGEQRAFRFQTRSHDDREEAAAPPREAPRPLPLPGRLTRLARAERFQLGNGLRVVLLPTSRRC